jgi:1-acyl-sn-glycerol-3-phosphate acyltransferase
MNAFRAGVQQIVERTPVPVVPLALSGLWGSFFSRASEGRAMRRLRGMFSRIAITGGAPIAPQQATPDYLRARVLSLRGERR